jgi:hypothetical protein
VRVRIVKADERHFAKEGHLTALKDVGAATALARALTAHTATGALAETRAGTATNARFLRAHIG